MMDMDPRKYDGERWRPPILKTEAAADKGVEELLEEIERHRKYLEGSESEAVAEKRMEKVRAQLTDILKNRMIEVVFNRLIESGDFNKVVESVAKGEIDPYTACDSLLTPIIYSGQ